MQKLIISLPDETATVTVGTILAFACQKAHVIYLYGDLGAGKTTLCRGLLRALGHLGKVKSPTYTLVEPYILPNWTIYHFDLYRLADPEELEFMGLRDYFNKTSMCLVEWPERGRGVLPSADIALTLTYKGNGRQIEAIAISDNSKCMLTQLLIPQQGTPS
ncbi:tRNA (adenosine(37)-N6)-threonylcarbamoyltransferase complex ATPase subunit type 1 TsaE [Sodalis endosymbiont of Henestaris halophilus]|uniref:tRNA (adenosine(37)-N6)-threonylcarbamoyltransferase complex ATPase subunit type 1 TsaE n=1 Tax=Sodalis endosymbiont of Henestaris halophilus TaxID=1929246 RepID=UPI000BC00686|nr:tRNA (adenosine(37)-N6)-threonylcarbamoyltransferase complex ATPase subunit type 1 TsaE [Sodalis endosymbiont of Henestaris halophilus]SNC58889.1 tRNA threonylcarbamoyladenosine biosynthesis protein TsaE [Sodalis endosymbiont of Henestaris halophilus]